MKQPLIKSLAIQDTVFAWAEFAMRNNTELLNNLGNFVNRLVILLLLLNCKIPKIVKV